MTRPRWFRPGSIIGLWLACIACSPATTTTPSEPAEVAAPVEPRIDAERMFAALEHLASDALAGRYSLSDPHIQEAARFLADAYRKAGIASVGPDHLVDFPLPAGKEPSDDFHFWIERDGQNIRVQDDAFVTLGTNDDRAIVADVVVVDPASPKAAHDRLAGNVALVWPADGKAPLPARLASIASASPAAIVVVHDGELPPKRPDAIPGVASIALQGERARELFGVEAPGASQRLIDTRVSLAPKPRDITKAVPNVLAALPGRTRPDEIVLLGAHYDHIGTAGQGIFCRPSPGQTEPDTICNGADDNASGTAMVLEIARALAETGYRPARTIVFAHFAGEELGLHGSHALANEPPDLPPFRNGRVVAMINLDMVGRLGEAGLAIGGIGSSSAWMDILSEIDEHGMSVVYERAISGRSDHASFYEKQVPILFFFTGVHEDYHRAGDEAAKINLAGMKSIAHMVKDTLLQVADGRPIPFTAPRTPAEGIVPRMPGTDPSTLEHRAEAPR
jgi:Zn-dependent M28 family amino/carboxypeptidase